jgi:hypothetical protein
MDDVNHPLHEEPKAPQVKVPVQSASHTYLYVFTVLDCTRFSEPIVAKGVDSAPCHIVRQNRLK